MCTSRRRNLSVSVRGLMYQCLREIFVSGRGTSVGERYLSIYVGFCDALMYALTSFVWLLLGASWVWHSRGRALRHVSVCERD